MKAARILKVIAIIEWVLGFILGILTGIAGGYFPFSYSYSEYSGGFNIIPMLVIWFIFFVMGMTQFGFGELLGHVSFMRRRTEEQLYYLTGAVQHLEGAVTQKNPAENGAKQGA